MKRDEIYLHETYADNGVDRVVFEYPKKLIDEFCEFTLRPNRFVFEQNTEMVLDRIRKLRRDLINSRKKHEPVEETALAAPDLATIPILDLIAYRDYIESIIQERTAPVWVDPAQTELVQA